MKTKFSHEGTKARRMNNIIQDFVFLCALCGFARDRPEQLRFASDLVFLIWDLHSFVPSSLRGILGFESGGCDEDTGLHQAGA
jgi:hypothetical protein